MVGSLLAAVAAAFATGCAARSPSAGTGSAPLTWGRNQFGVSYVAAVKIEPTFIPAGDGFVLDPEGDGPESAGVEVFYSRRIFSTSDAIAIGLDLPVMFVPTVEHPPLPEFFGPVSDYSALYVTPRVSFAYPAQGRWRIVTGLGGGVARFAETVNGQSRSRTHGVVHLAVAGAVQLRRGWALQVGYVGYGPERRLEGFNAGIAKLF